MTKNGTNSKSKEEVREKITKLFKTESVLKITENYLLTLGKKEDVLGILNDLEGKLVYRDEVYLCGNEDCYITFSEKDYNSGDEVECRYGHETILDSSFTFRKTYWGRLK